MLLSTPEAAWGGSTPPWKLNFPTWYEVETYTRGTPPIKNLIDDVIIHVT